jgi:hypothetical protein
MRKILIAIIVFQISFFGKSQVYDTSLVKLRTEIINDNSKIDIIYLSKKNQTIKTKFLAYKINNQSVYERFKDFSEQNILIYYSTAAYSEYSFNVKTSTPAGLSIDNGIIVNHGLSSRGMDGIVIISPDGSLNISNLIERIYIKHGNEEKTSSFDIKNSVDFSKFKNFANENKISVFQTHLLAWEGKLTFENNFSKGTVRERRFLAIGIDENGNEIHCLVNHEKYETLFNSSKNVLEFLQNEKSIKVTAMINMETGASDVAGFLLSNGVKSSEFSGRMDPSQSHNFLIYYFNK